MKKLFTLLLLTLLPLVASSQTGIAGIYYYLDSYGETRTAQVTSNPDKYSGDIVIPSTVTYNDVTYSVNSIGNSAFSGCTELTSVTIPESMTYIYGSAFQGCSALTSVKIPDSVTEIGRSAFAGCSALTTVTIGKGVSTIYRDAFLDCSALNAVHISDLAAWCKISFYNGYSSNPLALAHHLYLNDGEVKNLVIPDGVTEIKDYAYYGCSAISSVTIPSSVTYIGNGSFYECEALTAVHISDIGAWCNISFNGGNPLSIAQHLFLNGEEVIDLVIPEGTETISRYAFQCCKSVKSVTIPNSVKNIQYGAFAECEALSAVHVSDIGSWCNVKFDYDDKDGGYYNNPLNIAHHLYVDGEEVRDLVIPSNVNAICDGLFRDCIELTSVKMEEGLTKIGGSAFSGCKNIKTVEIPNSVTEIGASAFLDCTAITTINIGSRVTSIGESAFGGCSGLVAFAIPNGVKLINPYTFSGCTSLLSVTIPEGVETIGESAFYNCHSLANVVIPEGVKTIGWNAFYSCQGISSLTLPKSLESIGSGAFNKCDQIEEVKLADIAAWCNISLGENYGANPLALAQHVYVKDKEVTDLVIPDGVTSISNGAFRNCNWITSLTLPNGFTKIDENSFRRCYGLISVSLPNSLTTIDKYAFADCGALTSITIPSSVTTIGEYALRCTGLSSVVIPNGVTTINEYTFSDCYALTSLSIPESVTTIKGNAFNGCSKLENLIIPSKVEYIYQQAFANCGNLKGVKSLAETPPFLYDNSFSNYDIPLTVPEGARDAYLAKSPWNKFKEILTGSDTKYTLTYKVDDEVYSMYKLIEGAVITPEEAPVKAGYEFSGWSEIPATMPAEDVTVTGSFTLLTNEDNIKITSAGQSTWCSKYDLDFTGIDGLKAYIASGYDRISGTIWLTRVYQVPANEGIFLMGNAGDYKVPHISTGTYYANLMVGTLQPITLKETDGEYTNYYLSNGDSGVGFYKVNGSVDLKANRAYLPLLKGTTQAGTRFIGLGFEDDGTTNLTPALSKGEGEGAWHTLQGQRVAKPGKGIYIRNGKKVVIK